MATQQSAAGAGAGAGAYASSSEPEVLKITPSMIDDMKATVVMFMGAQMILSFFAVIWITWPSTLIIQILGPAVVFWYSVLALWITARVYKTFRTKLAVLN